MCIASIYIHISRKTRIFVLRRHFYIICQCLQYASVLKAQYAVVDHIKLINVFQKGSESRSYFLISYSLTFLPLHCLHGKNKIVENYITVIPIKTECTEILLEEYKVCHSCKQHCQAWDFQLYKCMLLLLDF